MNLFKKERTFTRDEDKSAILMVRISSLIMILGVAIFCLTMTENSTYRLVGFMLFIGGGLVASIRTILMLGSTLKSIFG